MISGLLFIGITLILILEGALTARLILNVRSRWLLLSLGLPIAALVNVLVVFVWTVAHVPLITLSVLLPHVVIAAILISKNRRTAKASINTHRDPETGDRKNVLEWLCMALIASTAIYSFGHAVLLPTFQYDSATNWTMRSEISFFDQKIAFDTNEDRGMAKPQYPFLFHALQITTNQGKAGFYRGVASQGGAGWNDTAANSILWLLSLSCFTALFLILRMLVGRLKALLTLTMILGIPLLSLHLGQSYADIVLLQELLLSLACLMMWIRRKDKGWLILSGILVASSVWTKSEGLFFGLIPWLLAIAAITVADRTQRKDALHAGLIALALSIPWQIFAIAKGLLLTPHSADTIISFHSEGVREMLSGLFDRGSFGIAWYVLLIAVPWMIIELCRSKKQDRTDAVPLAWGMLIFLEVIFIYLFTPNVQFLLNAESFYRQMMIPAAMLMLTVSVWFSARSLLVGTASPSSASASPAA